MSQQRRNMKTHKLCLTVLALFVAVLLVGCHGTARKSPDVSDSIRKSLDQAGLKDVSVSQDRDKGIVTLGGRRGQGTSRIDCKIARGGPGCRGSDRRDASWWRKCGKGNEL